MKLSLKRDTDHGIFLLVDKSGSMNGGWDDTLGSINNFIREQKDAGLKAELRIATFGSNGTYSVVYSGEIADAPVFTRSNMPCNGGMTALLDSTMTALGSLKEMPYTHKQLVTITDGGENDSKTYRGQADTVREALEAARVDGIDVVALAMGEAAWSNSSIYGANNTIRATASAASVGASINYLSSRTAAYATSDAMTFSTTVKTIAAVDNDGNVKDNV